MVKARKAKGNALSVDFTDVESRKLLDEGDYHVQVLEVKKQVSTSSGNEYLAWKFKVLSDDEGINGQTLFLNTSLTPQSLWNLRNLLETLGVEVPDGPVDLDLDDLVELEMIASTEHETYEGKKRSRIVDFSPLEEEEEKGKSKGKKDEPAKGKSKLKPVTPDEVMDMDEEELEEFVSKYGLKVDLDSLKTARKKCNAVIDALEEADLLKDE